MSDKTTEIISELIVETQNAEIAGLRGQSFEYRVGLRKRNDLQAELIDHIERTEWELARYKLALTLATAVGTVPQLRYLKMADKKIAKDKYEKEKQIEKTTAPTS